jgi:N-acetylneuraminic acid mutarotase
MFFNKIFIFLFIISNSIFCQNEWQWTQLTSLPFPSTNHVLASGTSGENKFVYLFGGIDSTKLPLGISNKGLRYNVTTNVWETIQDLPSGLPRIAAGASTIKNKIYIAGGYHVYENLNEESLNKLHIFDPETNTFLTDGEEIPLPIDDHVQAVWKDSLLFIVTGWSNTSNVSNVQIYNPSNNAWMLGTSVPNNNSYKAFGASGAIVGDTIYYAGGATGSNFLGTNKFRKGAINPNNPTEIDWTLETNNPGSAGYRMGAFELENSVYWIGGGENTYNFDGIAYDGSGGVEPLERIMEYNTTSGVWNEGLGFPLGVMDIRGIAPIDNNSFIIAGGMNSNQEVIDNVYLIERISSNDSKETSEEVNFKILNNPLANKKLNIILKTFSNYKIFNSQGQILKTGNLTSGNHVLDLSDLTKGFYFLEILYHRKKFIIE